MHTHSFLKNFLSHFLNKCNRTNIKVMKIGIFSAYVVIKSTCMISSLSHIFDVGNQEIHLEKIGVAKIWQFFWKIFTHWLTANAIWVWWKYNMRRKKFLKIHQILCFTLKKYSNLHFFGAFTKIFEPKTFVYSNKSIFM